MCLVGPALGAELPCRDHTLHLGQQDSSRSHRGEETLAEQKELLEDTTVSIRQN